MLILILFPKNNSYLYEYFKGNNIYILSFKNISILIIKITFMIFDNFIYFISIFLVYVNLDSNFQEKSTPIILIKIRLYI